MLPGFSSLIALPMRPPSHFILCTPFIYGLLAQKVGYRSSQFLSAMPLSLAWPVTSRYQANSTHSGVMGQRVGCTWSQLVPSLLFLAASLFLRVHIAGDMVAAPVTEAGVWLRTICPWTGFQAPSSWRHGLARLRRCFSEGWGPGFRSLTWFAWLEPSAVS